MKAKAQYAAGIELCLTYKHLIQESENRLFTGLNHAFQRFLF